MSGKRLGIRSTWYGERVVNIRTNLPELIPAAGRRPAEWRVSEGPVGYDAALKAMNERVDAIVAGDAPEQVWLLEHPPLYTAGTSAQPEELIEARFSVHQTGRGGEVTYHRPRPRGGHVMLDPNRRQTHLRAFVAPPG